MVANPSLGFKAIKTIISLNQIPKLSQPFFDFAHPSPLRLPLRPSIPPPLRPLLNFACFFKVKVAGRISLIFRMKEEGSVSKYNKITQQKKFHLLSLVLRDRLLIKEAARRVNINYSTAKTIVFFHRKHGKSYQFDFHKTANRSVGDSAPVAGYADRPINFGVGESRTGGSQQIEVLSTIGLKSVKTGFSVAVRGMGQNSAELSSSHSPKINYPTSHSPM